MNDSEMLSVGGFVTFSLNGKLHSKTGLPHVEIHLYLHSIHKGLIIASNPH